MKSADLLQEAAHSRRRQVPLLRHLRRVGERKLERGLVHCGSWMIYRHYLQGGETALRSANFCKRFMLCPWCARRRSFKAVGAYAPRVSQVIAARPGLIPAMVTLTIKTGSIGERLRFLRDSFKRMLKERRASESGSRGHAPIEWNKVDGAIKSIEIKRGKTGWHVHMHVFCLLSAFVDQKRLSRDWARFTGDGSRIVDVRAAYAKPGALNDVITPGLVEVLKYALKFGDLAPSDLLQAYRAVRGARVRLLDSQGSLRGVDIPDIESDPEAEGAFMEFLALWDFVSMDYRVSLSGGLDPSNRDVRRYLDGLAEDSRVDSLGWRGVFEEEPGVDYSKSMAYEDDPDCAVDIGKYPRDERNILLNGSGGFSGNGPGGPCSPSDFLGLPWSEAMAPRVED